MDSGELHVHFEIIGSFRDRFPEELGRGLEIAFGDGLPCLIDIFANECVYKTRCGRLRLVGGVCFSRLARAIVDPLEKVLRETERASVFLVEDLITLFPISFDGNRSAIREKQNDFCLPRASRTR